MTREITKAHRVKRILDKGGTLVVWKPLSSKISKPWSFILSRLKVFPVPTNLPYSFRAPSPIGGRPKSYYVKGQNTKALLYPKFQIGAGKEGQGRPAPVRYDVAMEFVNNKNDYHNRLDPKNSFWEIVSKKSSFKVRHDVFEAITSGEIIKPHKVKQLLNKGGTLFMKCELFSGKIPKICNALLYPGYKEGEEKLPFNVKRDVAMKFLNDNDYSATLSFSGNYWQIVSKKASFNARHKVYEAISSTMDDALNDLSLEGFDKLDEIAKFYKLDPVAVRNAWGEWKDHHDIVLRIRKQKKIEHEEKLTKQKEESRKRRKLQKKQSRLNRPVTKVLKIGKDGMYARDWTIITKKHIIEVESWLDDALSWALQDYPDNGDWGRYMIYMNDHFRKKGWDIYSAQSQILPRAISSWEKEFNKTSNASGSGQTWEEYASAIQQELHEYYMDDQAEQERIIDYL